MVFVFVFNFFYLFKIRWTYGHKIYELRCDNKKKIKTKVKISKLKQ